MCGYSSLFLASQSAFLNNPELEDNFIKSANKLSHRGNEAPRTFLENNVKCAHFRLAFQDLVNGAQPLFSNDMDWFIVFNGEIYNFKELQQQIKHDSGYEFKTNSDTEVLLAGYLTYKEKILEKVDGEFSFVIAKKNGDELFAARDFFGVKPLFLGLENISTSLFSLAKHNYEFQSTSLCFSSEIKGLIHKKTWNHEGFLRQSVGLYEAIRTPFNNIIQIPANSYLHAYKVGHTYNVSLILKEQAIRRSAWQSGKEMHALFDDFSACFKQSVQARTISDIELGVYLSGGIDSKAVAYELSKYMNSAKSHPINKVFSVGFHDQEYDELKEVSVYASKLGLHSYQFKVTQENLKYAYKHAVYHSENIQPFTNGAAKWWLSRFTAQHVRGVLTGDGADELLGGYPSFRYAAWWKFAMRSRKKKDLFEHLIHEPIGKNWRDSIYFKKFIAHNQNPWLSGSSSIGTGDDFIESLRIWGVPHPLFCEIKAITHSFLGQEEGNRWLEKQRDSIQSWFAFGLQSDEAFLHDPDNTLILWQNYFTKTHLPTQVLNWVGDRMEMANTLEGRTPFLSKYMRDFVFNLPDYYLVHGFEDKFILRHSYKRFIQQSAMTPKKQFGSPFLFDLDFNSEKRLLDKVTSHSLFDRKIVAQLFKAVRETEETNSAHTHSAHQDMYLKSALQTLHSFGIVNETLVENKSIPRNLELEEKVIATY